MILSILIFLILSFLTESLRLHTKQTHFQSQFSDKLAILRQTNDSLTQLRQSITNNLNSLKDSSQDERIYKLQTLIQQLRASQYKIYNRSFMIQGGDSYCDNIVLSLQNSSNNLNQIMQDINSIPPEQIIQQISPPFNVTDNTIQQLTDSINNNDTKVQDNPDQKNTSNLLASGWFPADKVNSLDYNNDSDVCPYDFPFVHQNGSCISCIYYNITSKDCANCQSYDEVKHICNYDKSTSNQTNPQNDTNNTTPQRVSSSDNLTGTLLPQNTTVEEYKQKLSSSVNNPNFVPCPLRTPFFDGTQCISCPEKQYFSVQKRICQTCPQFYVYNSTTYHCQQIKYYSNLDNPSWLSVGTPPSDIIKNTQNQSSQPNSQPCPSETPFFNGQKCISCPPEKPIYSYDAKQCTSCISPTTFNKNLHTCLNAVNRQTNPTSPNLIFSGRPLNQWNGYYFNNQTADNQKSDCPVGAPYFDGTTCITCPPETPYFNLEYKVCQNCKKEQSYDPNSRECLSVSGNIVSQEPSLLKMAATIFG